MSSRSETPRPPRTVRRAIAAILLFALAPLALVQLAAGEIQTAPTFNSCSYYYHSPADGATFRVQYRRAGDPDWLTAHAPVCDQPAGVHKGSLFNLDEDTEYQIRILPVAASGAVAPTSGNAEFPLGADARKNPGVPGIANSAVAPTVNPGGVAATFRTWTSAPRIAKTIDISTLPGGGRDGIIITDQGTPDAWIKYTAPEGWVVRRDQRDADAQDAVIVLKNARHIILENLTIEGGKRHSILVDHCDSVRILNCDLSGWGRTGVQQFESGEPFGKYRDPEGNLINFDGAVQVRLSANTVVERCYMHDPRGRTNSWNFSHPTGPEGVVLEYTLGGNVIRWNDFVGSDEHRFNDIISCGRNHAPEGGIAVGGLHRDSDVIGNYMAFCNDDGVELEGGGMNLRLVGNKVEGFTSGISFGPSLVGPQYAIGNLFVNPGDESGVGLMFIKNSHGREQKGRRFAYNNTFHGFDRSSAAYSAYGSATPASAGLGTMRNNIFVCNEERRPTGWARAENFDNDLFWVNRSFSDTAHFVAAFRDHGQEKNAITADPQLVAPASGDYRPAPSSPARGRAVEVPGITRAGDDLGAFFNGATDIPLRPLALVASPAQLNFPETGGTTTVTLSLPASAPAPVTFVIRQNNVFDWFAVTPASGIIAPGEKLRLTVTANPARLTGRPVFRGAFLVRAPDGLSRPVTVYAKGNYTREKRPASAGSNTIYIAAKSGAVNTRASLPTSATYYLLVRVSDPGMREGGGRGGFEISVNGTTTKAGLGTSFERNAGAGAGHVAWICSLGRLNAGEARVSIKSTIPELAVDEYIITDNPAAFFIHERNARR